MVFQVLSGHVLFFLLLFYIHAYTYVQYNMFSLSEKEKEEVLLVEWNMYMQLLV